MTKKSLILFSDICGNQSSTVWCGEQTDIVATTNNTALGITDVVDNAYNVYAESTLHMLKSIILQDKTKTWSTINIGMNTGFPLK